MTLLKINTALKTIARGRSQAAVVTPSFCPNYENLNDWKPYSKIPGPRPVPLLGNTWRLLPIIGQFDISDLAKFSNDLYHKYGKIVKLSGLIGRPDLLFIFDCDEIEKIYRKEGPTPFRPAMPCLVKYKSVERKQFFGELAGVVGVWVNIYLITTIL